MDLWSRRVVSAILIRIGLWSPCAVSGVFKLVRLRARKAVSGLVIRRGLPGDFNRLSVGLYGVSGTDQSSVEEIAAGHRGRDNATP